MEHLTSIEQPMAAGDLFSHLDGDGVLRVTLDRPPVNAFTSVEYRALAAALVGGREPVGCVLLSARGRLFSAGGDLADHGEDGGDAFELPVAALRSIWECPYPTVCAVNGTAAGFAVLVALGSDVIVASDRAVFVMPEIDTGTVGGICAIAEAAPRPLARAMGITGSRVPAARLADAGLIARMAPAATLDDVALGLARRIAARHRDGLISDWGRRRGLL